MSVGSAAGVVRSSVDLFSRYRRYVALILLLFGVFYVGKGVYVLLVPPAQVVTASVSVSFTVKSSLDKLFSDPSPGDFEFNSVSVTPLSVTITSEPRYGVESPWDKCTADLTLSLRFSGERDFLFGPYCYTGPGLRLSVAFWSTLRPTFTVRLPPGDYDMTVLASFRGVPIAEYTTSVHFPSAEEVNS